MQLSFLCLVIAQAAYAVNNFPCEAQCSPVKPHWDWVPKGAVFLDFLFTPEISERAPPLLMETKTRGFRGFQNGTGRDYAWRALLAAAIRAIRIPLFENGKRDLRNGTPGSRTSRSSRRLFGWGAFRIEHLPPTLNLFRCQLI